MKKHGRAICIVLTVIIAAAGLYLLLPGLTKRGDVHLTGYALTADGQEITLTVGVMSSAGYVRDVAVHQQEGGKLYLDCYAAFGGINGSIGAKNEFTVPLEEDTELIALYRADNGYEPVLEKDDAGIWQWV